MASVKLEADTRQHSNLPFDADVVVTGAPAGAKVTATLSQTRGRPSLWGPKSQTSLVGGSGSVTFTFNVTLQGPTLAVLLAEVTDDQDTPYPSDAETIEVL